MTTGGQPGHEPLHRPSLLAGRTRRGLQPDHHAPLWRQRSARVHVADGQGWSAPDHPAPDASTPRRSRPTGSRSFLHPEAAIPPMAPRFSSPRHGRRRPELTSGLDRSIAFALWQTDGRALRSEDPTALGRQQPLKVRRKLDSVWWRSTTSCPWRERRSRSWAPSRAAARALRLRHRHERAPPAHRLPGRDRAIPLAHRDRELARRRRPHRRRIVTYPPDFTPGRAWPLVFHPWWSHGHPTRPSASRPAHAARGWIVLQPNYRAATTSATLSSAIAAGAGRGRDAT